MKRLVLSLLLLTFLCNFSFAQERWTRDPRLSIKPAPLSNYVKLPYTSWENTNKQTSVYMTPAGVMAVGPNFRVLPNSNQQDEIILSSNPAFPLIMFGSSNSTAGSTYSQGVYVTTNGGLNWYGTDIMPNCPVGASDPAPAIDKNGVFVFTTLNTAGSVSMLGMTSSDNGVTFTSPVYINGGSPSDKNMIATDDVPGSPYYGRTYTVWSKTSGTWPIMVSYTTNSGGAWSTAAQINTPSVTSQGCDVVIGPGGVVYVTWSKQSGVSVGIGFAKSTNGGVTWTVNETAMTVNGMRSNAFNGWNIRTNDFPRIACDKSGGPRNGWIYIVDCEQNIAPAGSDPDIVLHKSSDGGTTWSAGVRVNQDALSNAKVQFFPCVAVDANGGVNVLYYDNRNYPSVGDSCETYMSRSVDGGLTYTDIKVSDHRWKPAPEPGLAPYAGDYIGITVSNGKIWPFWFDNKTGSMQAWTAPIDIGPAISHTPLTNTELIAGTRPVNCVITPSGSGINPSTVKLYYSKDNPVLTSNITLTNSSGTNWTANLPLSGAGLYRYYVTATDSLIRTATAPAGAPTNVYSFTASADLTPPVINHTPLLDTPKPFWPASVTATVTDNIGVDSVWVEWYKNIPANAKEFKLIASGSTYTASFNSLNGDVTIGDSIFYRVKAKDISAAGNIATMPASGYYRFYITPLTTNAFCRNGLTLAIPDNNPTGVSDSLNVSLGAGSTILDVNVRIDTVVHTFDGDLSFTLSHLGTTVPLVTRRGSSGDNFIGTVLNDSASTLIGSGTSPFTGQFKPESVLSVYNGMNPNGYWTIKVVDGASIDVGTLNAWCVVIQFSTPTGVIGTTEIPLKYVLAQNYPNPFNPVTKINFAIPKQGLVTLKVYDVLGREVRTLVNEVKSVGTYAIDFNGSELSSGVYFYRLTSADFTDIKRMILLK